MKLILLSTLMLSTAVQAAPFLYGDVQNGVTTCGMVMDGAAKVTTPSIPGTPVTCKFDLAQISTGPHTATMTAIINDPVWGVLESAPSTPFLFTRPVTPTAPTTPRLAP